MYDRTLSLVDDPAEKAAVLQAKGKKISPVEGTVGPGIGCLSREPCVMPIPGPLHSQHLNPS